MLQAKTEVSLGIKLFGDWTILSGSGAIGLFLHSGSSTYYKRKYCFLLYLLPEMYLDLVSSEFGTNKLSTVLIS